LNQRGHTFWPPFRLPSGGITKGFKLKVNLFFLGLSAAVGTYQDVVDLLRLFIQGHIRKHDLPGAGWATEHFAPHHEVDSCPTLAVGVQSLVHPTNFFLKRVEQLLASPGEVINVEWLVVVGGDEGG